MSFKDKVVIITGAGSGIGAATAIAFTAEGGKVAMVDINETKLKKVAEKCEQIGSKPLVIIADVSKKEDIQRIKDETLDHFGKLDVLVNNAGIYAKAGILAADAMEVHERLMATNLQSGIYLTHLTAPHLIKTKGNIINVSSVAALGVVVHDSFSYLTSKAGVDHFTRAMAIELGPKGVRVNSVNPGGVQTDILNSPGITVQQQDKMWQTLASSAPLGKNGEPEEIADVILFLASDKARSITGATIVSDNGSILLGASDI